MSLRPSTDLGVATVSSFEFGAGALRCVDGVDVLCGGTANASSANASVTLCEIFFFCAIPPVKILSNANLLPES